MLNETVPFFDGEYGPCFPTRRFKRFPKWAVGRKQTVQSAFTSNEIVSSRSILIGGGGGSLRKAASEKHGIPQGMGRKGGTRLRASAGFAAGVEP